MPLRSASASSLSRASSRDSISFRGHLDKARNFSSCAALLSGSEPATPSSNRVPNMSVGIQGGWVNSLSSADLTPARHAASSSASDEACAGAMSPTSPRARADRDKEPQFSAVRVVLRFRPPMSSEYQQEDAQPAFIVDPVANCVESPDCQHRFQFDRALTEEASQEMVYDDVGRPVVDDVLQGYHGTILAYGQTGSGKTYCMFGPSAGVGQQSPELQGLVPRAATQVFDHVGEFLAEDAAGTVECSFFEVYCEQMRDLLKPGNSKLQVKENTQKGFFVEGLTHKPVNSVNEVIQVLRSGLRQRAAANTRLNHHSSRSHAIFTLRVQQRTPEGLTKNGKLTLVDLAGSEKVHKSGSDGEMLEEAKKINSSLSVLGHVIDALAERRSHVPYRDSKLTRILEDSLGGNCRTTLLVACSPSSAHVTETLSSLRFAARAKKVCNYARVNITQGAADRQLLNKIAQLRRELAKAHHELEQRFARDRDGRSPSPSAPGSQPNSAIKPRMMARSWTKETLETEAPTSDIGGPGQGQLLNSASASSITSSLPCRAPSVIDGLAPTIVTVSGASREDHRAVDGPGVSREDCASDVLSTPRAEAGSSSAAQSPKRSRQGSKSAPEPPALISSMLCPEGATNDDMPGRKYSWLIEATPLHNHSMQHKSTGMLPHPCQVLGGPAVEPEEEDDPDDITSDVRELQLRLELERTRCATLSMELEQRTQESKTLWRQLEEAEARTTTVQLANGTSMPVLPILVQEVSERVYTPRQGNHRQDSVQRSISAQRRQILVASRTTTPSPLRAVHPGACIKSRAGTVAHGTTAWVSPRRSSPTGNFRRTGSLPITRMVSTTTPARRGTPIKRSISPVRLQTLSTATSGPSVVVESSSPAPPPPTIPLFSSPPPPTNSRSATTPRGPAISEAPDASVAAPSAPITVASETPPLAVNRPAVVVSTSGIVVNGTSLNINQAPAMSTAVPVAVPPTLHGDPRVVESQRWMGSPVGPSRTQHEVGVRLQN